MLSLRGHFAAAQVGELGGEFIDSDHLHMQALARELAIELDDRELALGADVTRELFWLRGARVDELCLSRQLADVATSLGALVAASERDAATFARLDRTPLSLLLTQWLGDAPELAAIIETAYRGEYGLEIDQQSALNFLYLIGLNATPELATFGSSDERFHCATGNGTFAERLSARLERSIVRNARLVAARGGPERGYLLTFEHGRTVRDERADLVVFSLPFTLLREVDLTALPLSSEKRRLIAELGYGTNAKLLAGFERRLWLEQHRASGSVCSDEPWQQCWDSAVGQAGANGLITNFLGGEAGRSADRGEVEPRCRALGDALEPIFPGVMKHYMVGRGARMHWPSQPFAKGSYSCYRPGQWAHHGREGAPEASNTLHFCGEHTSLDHQGYMEGAAESGALTAAAILALLGLRPSSAHTRALALSRSVPQPALGEPSSARSYVRRGRERKRTLARCAPTSVT